MALSITATLVTPTSVSFVDAAADITMIVYKLDENNAWATDTSYTTESDTMTHTITSDGVYRFHIDEYGGDDERDYVYVCYEVVKSKLRQYIQSQLCNCCEDNCNPCDNNIIYDFTMLVHLSLAYLGNNKYILATPDLTSSTVMDILESINNAIVRTAKYILQHDI